MALKWWQTVDIVERESDVSRQKTESLLDRLATQARLRREQMEREAGEAGAWNAQLASSFTRSYQRATAADEIDVANRKLSQLGLIDQIPISESTIKQQIMSGRTWTDSVVRQAEEASWQDRIAELRKEAEHDAKLVFKEGGGDWGSLTYTEKGQQINAKLQGFLIERHEGETIPGYGKIEDTRLGAQIPEEGLELAEGIKVMPDYTVYSDEEKIGSVNPETGEFQEMEIGWWEKARNIVKWFPPLIPNTLIEKYGAQVAEKIDLPFMIQYQAYMLADKGELNANEQAFVEQYKQEVGKLPDIGMVEASLFPPLTLGRLWSGAELRPSEELKKVYYESTGIGYRILHGITTPTMVALFVAGGLGGATALQPKLAATATRGGVRGAAAQATQMVTAPVVGYEWVIGKAISATVGGTYKVVMTSVLKRNLRSWAKSVGVEIPKATEDAFIRQVLPRLRPQFMGKMAVKTMFKPVKGGHTVTQAGATAAEQAAAQSVKTSPLLLGLTKKPAVPPTAVAPKVAKVPTKVTPTTKQPFTATVYRGVKAKGVAPTDEGLVGKAEYWTTDRGYAATYGTVKETTVKLDNPLVIKTQAEWDNFAIRTRELRDTAVAEGKSQDWVQTTLRSQLEAEGYDGVVVAEGIVESGKQVAVFHPETAIAEAAPTEMAGATALAEWETTTLGEPLVEGILEPVAELSPAKLRQSIMASGKGRGLSQTKLNEIFRDVVGKSEKGRQLPYRLTEMTDAQLQDTLEIVKSARPVRIGTKIVIRPSTEKKIQSLKASLITGGKLTDEAFDSMVNQLGLSTVKYETATKFITEKEGNSLIRLMNDEAEVGLIARQADVAEALETNPTIKEVYDDFSSRIAKEGKVYFEGKPADASMLKDQRFAMEDLQVRTGKEFYDVYFSLNRAKNANRAYFEDAKKRLIAATPQYNTLVNNKAGMQRIRDYIAAKNNWTKVKSPTDITPEEIKLANAYEKELFDLQPDFRYHRFVHQYHTNNGDVAKMQEHIPDASKEQLRKAVNIYEGQGGTKLREHLDTQTWGIIGSGYEPHYVVTPQLAMRKLKAAFATRRLEPRTGVEFYPEDITIDKAVERYIHQIRSYNLRPYVRKMERLYAESLSQLKNPRKVNRGISIMLNEMLGYKDRTFFGELVMKVASQAYITVFGTFPTLPFRNLFQNLAHHPDKSALIDPRNRKLTDWEMEFYNMHTSQMKGINKDQLLSEEGGLPGFRRINRFVLRLNIYGASDSKVNRVWSLWASLNKADRALTIFKKDGNIKKFVSDSGMAEMTFTQQKQILENLAMPEVTIAGLEPVSGGQAAITEIANEITNNVHFMYDRSQRAWIEMGEMGRIVGSLVVFPRSVVQRALIQAKVLDPKSNAPPVQKKRAAKVIFALLWGSMAANYLFQKATGRTDAPYNPVNILKWSPGGLSLGAITNLTEVSGLLVMAIGGSDWAKGQLPATITRTSDTFVPYYKTALQVLESALEKKHIDRQLYRELRSIFEKAMRGMGFLGEAYEPNKSFYEAERSAEWRLKHALFGTEPEEGTAKDTTLNVQRDILSQYEFSRDWEDLNKTERDALLNKYPDLKE